MKPINHLFPILSLVALILSACQPLLPPAVQNAPAAPAVEQSMPASPAQPQGLRADAPPYAVHGPYAVGVGNFKIEATTETERPLTVTVWYPALNPQGVPESLTYEMGFPAGETPNVSVLGHAIESATPAIDGAPYPLIVHTHGHWSFRQEAAYLDEHLASMGFVVISADHEDNWSTLFGPKAWQSEFRRPNEVTREIDYAEKLGAVGGPLAGIVDTGHVGVIGWSYGGETALVAAGARLDLGKLRTWCEENKVDGEFPDTDCVDILDHEAELAALAGLNETPQGLWPDWSDERVDAVIGLAPWVGLLSEASLQTLNVPTLLMIGSADTAAGPTYRPFQPYQKIAAERKAEVIFENAEHLLFFSACQDVPEVVGLGLEVFCSDPVWDMARAHDLTAHFATAFLLAELKNDTDAAAAMTPENVAFTGVQYQETGYSEPSEVNSAAEPQPPHGLRFDAPEYAIDGPYTVGVRYVNIPAATEGDRDLIATVWYPAQKSNGAPAEMVYEQQFAPGEIPAFTVLGHAQLNAPPDASGAPYPLVVYSHAHWSFGQETAYLTEHLASRGFVVISADHEDNWSTAFGPLDFQAMIRRPQEVTRQIDYAESLTAADGSLPGMIDTTGVGVAGWSMGGETALAVAGARWDINSMRTWCTENPDGAALNEWACIDILEKEAEMATFAGLAETPKGLWPSVLDERIHAAISLAGPTNIFGSEGIQSIHVPVMFLVGSGETSVDPAFEMAKPYESISSEHKAKVVLDHSEHMVFFSSCADSPSVAALGFPMFCTDPVWDMDRAHDLINHFATAFLLAELKGDSVAAAALAAENVNFSGVQYEATGYETVSESAPQSGLDDATVAKIEALVEQTMTNGQVPGAAVGVVKDGKLVYSKGFGVTALGSDESVTPETVFVMMSIAKSGVGMAIMQLVEEGKIDLDAPVTDYLPYFTMADPDVEGVTIRRLLSHTAGVPDPVDFVAEYRDENKRTDVNALDDYLRSLSDQPLTFQPGEQWSYSNTGFDLLADVVAKVSGQSFEDYMQEHILTPLGMEDSSYLLSDVNPAKLAAPHTYDENGKAMKLNFFPYTRIHAPSGGLLSTVNDMARFAIANMNHGELEGTRVLQAATYDEMWAPQAASPWADIFGPQVTSYALGWWVGEFNGHSMIGNYGADAGFQTHLGIFPDEGYAIIAMVNLHDLEAGSFYAYDIGNGIAALLLDATKEAFVQGAPVRLAVGLAVGPDDNLYVSNQWVRSLLVLDPDTGEIVKRYGPEDGVDIPADLAFGPDGSLYASMYPGFEGDAVMRMHPDGKVTGMPLPPIIWPVMTTKDGRLFAGLLDQNDKIVELDPDFQLPPRQLLTNGTFIHMREGPDELIYALKWFDGEIVRFDPDAPENVETVASGLTLPFNLAFDSKGQLYIIIGVDDATDAVARLDLTTGKPEILATMHSLLYGLAIDSKDRVFVSTVDNGTIFEVLPDGNTRIVSPGGMILPSDVEMVSRPDGESIFLADWVGWREYDAVTGELRSTRYGTWWPGTLANPDTIAPFGDNLLMASSEGQQIQIWDPVQQKEVLPISYPGADNAIGFAGAIVATSYESKDVVSIDPANPEQRTVLAAGLAYPLGLATEAGNLYVGDFLAGQILQVAADGVKLESPKLIAEGLQGPEGMALTGDGRLLVVESGANRLSIVDIASGQISTLIPELGLLRDLPRSRPLHYFFNGVDVSPSGMIYVTADESNMIYRLPLPPK